MIGTHLPAFDQSGPLKFDPPLIQKSRLASGWGLWLVRRPDLPLIWLRLVFGSGADADPPEKPGTASLAMDLLDAGTSTMDALEISDRYQRLGSSLQAGAGHDASGITITSLQRHFESTVRLFGEVLSAATYPESEFSRLKKRRITSIAQRKNDPASVTSAAFDRILFGSRHVYGTDPGGTEFSLGRITRDDLFGHYQNRYRSGPGTIIAIGNISANEFADRLESLLPPASKTAPPTRVTDTFTARGWGITLIDRPDAPQSEIRLGTAGPPRSTADFFPLVIMNRILGGQFTSRLNENLRERKGFTYGARSSFGFGKYGGPFVASAAVGIQNTAEALTEMEREIVRIHKGGVDQSELASAKEGLMGGFALAFESPSQLGPLLQSMLLYNLPEDYLATYLENIRRVTREDIQRVAERYLDVRAMGAVIVGDLRKIRSPLEEVGVGEVREATIEELGI